MQRALGHPGVRRTEDILSNLERALEHRTGGRAITRGVEMLNDALNSSPGTSPFAPSPSWFIALGVLARSVILGPIVML